MVNIFHTNILYGFSVKYIFQIEQKISIFFLCVMFWYGHYEHKKS